MSSQPLTEEDGETILQACSAYNLAFVLPEPANGMMKYKSAGMMMLSDE